MNNIILIDDREDFATEFIETAKNKSINVSHKRSFDGLKEIIPKYSHKFSSVVLDIKCLINDDQEIEDESFINVALKYLDSHAPEIPRCILTGDDKAFSTVGVYFKDEQLFMKTPEDLDRLFLKLDDNIKNSDLIKIRRKHSLIFEMFGEGKLDLKAMPILEAILIDGYNETDYNKFKGVLSNIRSVQELIYKSINKRNKLVVPDSMFKPNGMILFPQLMKHLSGNPVSSKGYIPTTTLYQNSTIENITKSIYWGCGEYIHEDPTRSYFISEYVLKSHIYSLLELLLWSKQF